MVLSNTLSVFTVKIITNIIVSAFFYFFTIPCYLTFGEVLSDSLRMRLDTEIFKTNPNSSVVISPLAVHLPLCKLASVAHGGVRDEILSVLGYKTASQLKTCFTEIEEVMSTLRDIDSLFFNKIYVDTSVGVNSKFLNDPVNYGTKVEKIGFNLPTAAAAFINRWVDTSTLKRISNIIESKDINKDMSVVFISAVYLKVTWEFPFDVKLTKPMTFRHTDGRKSTVMMMTSSDSYLYVHDAKTDVQFINIKLASFGVTVTFGIPYRSYGLSGLMQSLSSDPTFMFNVYKRMKIERINLKIPRFKIKTQLDFTKHLKQIGLQKLFNTTNSGLDSILMENKTKNVYLSKVKQNCFIDVDERGVFRGASIGNNNEYKPYRMDLFGREVTADRAFYFSINIQQDLTDPSHVRQLLSGVYRGPDSGWNIIQ